MSVFDPQFGRELEALTRAHYEQMDKDWLIAELLLRNSQFVRAQQDVSEWQERERDRYAEKVRSLGAAAKLWDYVIRTRAWGRKTIHVETALDSIGWSE